MSDLISKKALLEELKKHKKYFLETFKDNTETVVELNGVFDLINSAPAVSQPQSVKDALELAKNCIDSGLDALAYDNIIEALEECK